MKDIEEQRNSENHERMRNAKHRRPRAATEAMEILR